MLSGADPSAFHILIARLAGENVATAIALDHDGDCGAHDTLQTVLGYTGADIAAAACRRIQVPRIALGADGIVTDAAIRDEVATALRTLADYAASTSTPSRPRTAPGPADS